MRTSEKPAGKSNGRAREPASEQINLLSLQRHAGNQAVEGLLSEGRSDKKRAPVAQRQAPGSTAVVPASVAQGLARVAKTQNAFVALMREASDIITWTQDYYKFINGTYQGCYGIHKMVLAQSSAAEEKEKVTNEIIGGMLATAALIVFPEVVAALAEAKEAFALKPVIELLPEKLKPGAEGLVGAGKEALTQALKPDGQEGKAQTPEEIEVISLSVVVDLLTKKDSLDMQGMSFFSDAVTVISHLIDVASGAASKSAGDSVTAVDAIVSRADELIAGLEKPMAEFRSIRDRLWKDVPSWETCEQDIWITYYNVRGGQGWQGELQRKHVADIHLAGPEGETGGRLGVPADINLALSSTSPTVVRPGQENEKLGMSTEDRRIGLDEVLKEEADRIKPIWRRRLLLPEKGA